MNIPDLFSKNTSPDKYYLHIKNEELQWHKTAKAYWNQLHSKYESYLDNKFMSQFPFDTISCLWELTIANYLSSNSLINLLEVHDKNKICAPDFLFSINNDNRKFYVEVVTANVGESGLGIPFETFIKTPIIDADKNRNEYRTRITNSFTVKAEKYNKFIADNGLIIAILMAKIPLLLRLFHNHKYIIDFSCFFNISPYGEPEEAIYKGNAKINTNYFEDEKYSHISAILISYLDVVFFPEQQKYGLSPKLGSCQNDFLLIHNPNAFEKIRLPYGILPVAKEIQL